MIVMWDFLRVTFVKPIELDPITQSTGHSRSPNIGLGEWLQNLLSCANEDKRSGYL